MKQYFPLVVSALLAFVLAGGYTFMLMQTDGAIGRIEEALVETDVLARQSASFQSAQAFLADTSDLRVVLDRAVVGRDEIVPVIELLENAARREGVSLSLSNVSVAGEAWQYHERLALSFSAQGTFHEITRFIGALEALPRVARLESGALESAGGREWFGTFIVSFVKEK